MVLDIKLIKQIKTIFKKSKIKGEGLGGDEERIIIKEVEKELFIQPVNRDAGPNFIGNWHLAIMSSTESIGFNFFLPPDFISLTSAKIIMIPDATETIQWDISASVSAIGENHNIDDRTSLNQTQSVTINDLTELDILGILGNLTANDYIGIRFESDINSILAIGLRIRYT